MHVASSAGRGQAATPTLSARRAAGTAQRRQMPRSLQAAWQPAADRRDPVAILIAQGETRIPELLPVRYARMQADPFAFLRGAAAVMAADLGAMQATGLPVQSCGDCHLANFGTYATPEGTPVFDITDFDETLPAPFEWDLKRLATSLVVSGRVEGHSAKACRQLARSAAAAYRGHMARLALLAPVDAWGSRIDLAAAIAGIDGAGLRSRLEKRLAAVLASNRAQFGLVDRGRGRIRDKPPLLRRLDRHALHAKAAFAAYAATLQEDRRVLLDRYHLRDVAFKVVGVGSVGTFCAIALLISDDGAPLLLQIKQAQESVLAPYAGASAYANHGQRVVVGQRMMQADPDLFLGWADEPVQGCYFYVRRLKDSRLAELGERIAAALPFHAELCGRTLARAHARTGDAVAISAYLGEGDGFDKAIATFAQSYADQTERDWQEFRGAIRSGRISAGEG